MTHRAWTPDVTGADVTELEGYPNDTALFLRGDATFASPGGGPHASDHEDGGSDEISVDGLAGLLADDQNPLAHAVSHQNGGADEVSVAGLSGLLADQQTPLTHDILTKHNGFPGGTSNFLRADGAFAAPLGGAGASWTIYEANLGGVGAESWRGKFTFSDAAITPSSKVIIQQAPGPYTGKGTRADEAEMDPLWCVAEPGSGQATVYWRTMAGIAHVVGDGNPIVIGARPETSVQGALTLKQRTLGRVRGSVKFQYTVA